MAEMPDGPEPSQRSAEERKNLLDGRVRELTRENRASLRSQADFDAVLVRGKVTNHLVMFVILACVMAVAAVSGRILGDVGAGALAAIVFGLPTVGPAIVGSLNVGDVWVTATFMLVLATTLIAGNIISDILLALLDPRVRLGGAN